LHTRAIVFTKSVELVAALHADEAIGSMEMGHAIAEGGGLPTVEHITEDTPDA
jgi:hypothetical protein